MQCAIPGVLTEAGSDWGEFELPNGEQVDVDGTRRMLAFLARDRFVQRAKRAGCDVSINLADGTLEAPDSMSAAEIEEIANAAFESVWTDLDDGEIRPLPLNP